VRLTAAFCVLLFMARAEGLAGGSFIWPQAVSASEIVISPSLSFSELGGKHKKRYFGSDL